MSSLRLTWPFIILFIIFILPIIHFVYLLALCIVIFLNFLFNLVHTYPDILENGHFFSVFEKSFSSVQRETLKQHTIQGMRCMMICMTSSYSKTSVSFLPHQKDKPAGPLNSGDHFHEPAFLVPETPLTCGPKA